MASTASHRHLPPRPSTDQQAHPVREALHAGSKVSRLQPPKAAKRSYRPTHSNRRGVRGA